MRDPADAAVAMPRRLLEHAEAEVGDGGAVEVAGRPTGLQRPAGTRPVIVAAWGAGVQLRLSGAREFRPREHVSPGPGSWEITLTHRCRAHVPLGTPPPRPGVRRAARLDRLAAILQPRQVLMI